MILSQLSSYLRDHQRASVADITLALNCNAEVLESMLVILERKGRVRRLPVGATCGHKCCKCDPTSLQIYEWCGDKPSQPASTPA